MAGHTSSFRILILVVWVFLTSSLSTTLAAVTFDSYTSAVSVAVNVPQNTTDDLYFHFSASADNAWAAFGFGRGMSGALMFVVYAADGNNGVTVGPRLGTGHNMPQWTNDTQLNLLDGTGVVDGNYVVNAHCRGCRKWKNGNVDVTSTSQAMIWATGPTGTVSKSDVEAKIAQHTENGAFSLDLKKATGEAGVPVLAAATTGDTTSDTDDEGPDGRNIGIAFHAFIMCAAFLIIFPAGYLFLRVFEKVWLHWGIQTFAVVMVLMGTASGITVSIRQQIFPKLTHPHQIIGLLVMILALAAWTLGLVGHRIYKKTGTPAKVMLGHRILGPSTIGLGLINACIGFNFAGNNHAIIGFVIVSTAMMIFVSSIVFLKKRRTMRKAAMTSAAAHNFREGQMYPPPQGGPPPPGYSQAAGYYEPQEQGIQMQSYGQSRQPDVEEQYRPVQTVNVVPK